LPLPRKVVCAPILVSFIHRPTQRLTAESRSSSRFFPSTLDTRHSSLDCHGDFFTGGNRGNRDKIISLCSLHLLLYKRSERVEGRVSRRGSLDTPPSSLVLHPLSVRKPARSLDSAESRPELPLKMRTFSKITAAGGLPWARAA
jgi:hypothetical protein